jgi:hypothetical protein
VIFLVEKRETETTARKKEKIFVEGAKNLFLTLE